jgi:hypothetical protein
MRGASCFFRGFYDVTRPNHGRDESVIVLVLIKSVVRSQKTYQQVTHYFAGGTLQIVPSMPGFVRSGSGGCIC